MPRQVPNCDAIGTSNRRIDHYSNRIEDFLETRVLFALALHEPFVTCNPYMENRRGSVIVS
mgnify:FL=1